MALVEPHGGLRPVGPRPGICAPRDRQGDADAGHHACGDGRGLPGTPPGDGDDAACGPTQRRPVHARRGVAGRGRGVAAASARVRGVAAEERHVEAWLEERFGAPKPRVWWALRHTAVRPRRDRGPWRSAAPATLGAPSRSARGCGRIHADPCPPLPRRVRAGTAQDIARFGMLYRPLVRKAIDRSATRSSGRGSGRRGTHRRAGGLLPPQDAPLRHALMAMWTAFLLPTPTEPHHPARLPQARDAEQRRRAPDPRSIDGLVAGVWRPPTTASRRRRSRAVGRGVGKGLEKEARTGRPFFGP